MEFSTEPFDLDGVPPHALEARRVIDEAGLDVEVGPFGTTAEGEAETVLTALDRVFRGALGVGASRISVQVTTVPEPPADREAGAETGLDTPGTAT
ncbi:thiamine-binding protein [Embleya sp. NBC_00896]|uniref:thiamine-binding protein n=1 Tax=Embleya sp. NBC_00896 TaxID=2975961 RepID=UPI003863E0E0